MGGQSSAIAAIHRTALADWASRVLAQPDAPTELRDLAARAQAACVRIGDDVFAERRRLTDALATSGIDTTPPTAPEPAQRHEMVLPVGPDDVDGAVEVLAGEGYERPHRLSAGAERSRRRTSHEVVLRRSADVTTVVRLRWRTPSEHTGPWYRLLRPRLADWAAVDLPAPLWWAYAAVRPVRLVAERVGLAERDHGDLEPFLVTPASLLDPLFDTVDLHTDDVLVDLGCGDGRVVIEGARRRHCRAIGVERSKDLAARARIDAAGSGHGDLVRIVEGDGLAADLGDPTVVFAFLPVGIAARVVPTLLARLRPGARVLVHEQSPLPPGLTPDSSRVLVADDAVTVAHVWTVASRPSDP